MNESSTGTPSLDTPRNTQNNQWTCVSWFKKISDAVASKTSHVFGRVVAAVVSVVAFIPSLAVDLAYAAKSLYDRKITTHESTSLPWKRKIHDGFVQDTMTRHNQFLEKHLLHQLNDIPLEALNEATDSNVSIELITPPDDVKTIKIHELLRNGESRKYYDISGGQALAWNKCPYQFYDELMMNCYIQKLGIPTIEIKPAVLSWEFEGTKYTRANYVTPSFNEYEKQNAFLWQRIPTPDEKRLMANKKLLTGFSDAELLVAKNWDEALKPLVNDVRTLIDHGLTANIGGTPDPHKAIVVGKGNKFHSGGPADYEIRAFPFEFVNETGQLDKLPPKKRLSAENEKRALRHYIELALFVQLDRKKYFLPNSWKTLLDDLVNRHSRR